MMLEQRQRYDQRHDALMILGDDLLDFLLVFTGNGLFQITTQVMQDVGVSAARGALFQGRHQLAEVHRRDFIRVGAAHAAEQLAQCLVLHRVIGHQLVFVARVEFGQGAPGDAFFQQLLPGRVGKHAGDEVFAQHGIVEPPVFLDRQIRMTFAEGLRIDAATAAIDRGAVFAVDLDALQAAGRGFLHEDVAADITQLSGHLYAVICQCLGDVQVTIDRAERLRVFCVAYQPDRLAGDAHADSNFRTRLDEIEILAQRLCTQMRFLVSAIEANLCTHQAGTDAEFGFFDYGRRHQSPLQKTCTDSSCCTTCLHHRGVTVQVKFFVEGGKG